jgi:hypothetical protein
LILEEKEFLNLKEKEEKEFQNSLESLKIFENEQKIIFDKIKLEEERNGFSLNEFKDKIGKLSYKINEIENTKNFEVKNYNNIQEIINNLNDLNEKLKIKKNQREEIIKNKELELKNIHEKLQQKVEIQNDIENNKKYRKNKIDILKYENSLKELDEGLSELNKFYSKEIINQLNEKKNELISKKSKLEGIKGKLKENLKKKKEQLKDKKYDGNFAIN